jgi:hypothetical protein
MTGRPFSMAEVADQGPCKDCGTTISVPTRRADGSFYWQCASCAESADSAETPSHVAASSDSRDLFALPALSAQEQEREWPTLGPAAHHGLAGKVVATLGPHTEADPVALLLSFLVAFGNAANPAQGLGPRALVGATAHPARLNVLLVGETARARKGTAQGEVNRLMRYAAPEWYATRVMGGLASGEGLIAAVDDGDPLADKRLLVVESEFARVLAVAAREGNTLSAVLRQAWDTGDLRTMTRKDPLCASGAHISIVGHITAEELLRRLGDTEIANGFANRFLFALVRRSRKLPEGGQLDPAALDDLTGKVKAALGKAQQVGILRRSEEARELWHKTYDGFGDGETGLAGALTARPEAQTLRLSVCYALLDGSPVIGPEHIRAALAVWEYCEASAHYVFGSALGDPVADQLLAAVAAAGPDGLDGEQQRAVFSRHVSASRLGLARAELEHRGFVITESEQTGGRPRLVTRIRR